MTAHAPSPADDKLAYIDALRGLAVLMVIVYHVGHALVDQGLRVLPFFKGGQYGVQLFFVASAFTLCLSHRRRADESAATAKFFLRRFFRIAPLYYFGLIAYGVLRGLHEGGWPARYDAASILTNLTFTHGFAAHTINYVVPGGWSIACEMLFYVLLPPILLAVDAPRKALGLWLAFTLAQVALGGATMSARFDAERAIEPAFFYFWLPNQLPVFAAGIYAYFVWERARRRSAAQQRLIGGYAWLVCVVLGGLAAGLLLSGQVGRWNHVVMPTVCGAVFGSLLLAASLRPSNLLVNGVLRTFGRYSYGGYIAHFALIWLLVNSGLPARLPLSPSFVLWPLLSLAVAALTLVAAMGLHFAIESPGIELGRTLLRRLFAKRPALASSPLPN